MSQSQPSQHQLRAELEQMVLGDLLGPAGGEHEELTERTVRDRYLVGVLAPSRGARVEKRGASDKNSTTGSPILDDEDDEEIPSIPDELMDRVQRTDLPKEHNGT